MQIPIDPCLAPQHAGLFLMPRPCAIEPVAPPVRLILVVRPGLTLSEVRGSRRPHARPRALHPGVRAFSASSRIDLGAKVKRARGRFLRPVPEVVAAVATAGAGWSPDIWRATSCESNKSQREPQGTWTDGAGCRPRSHGKTDINPTSAELTPWWAARAQIATTTAIATKATDTRIRTS